MTLKYTDPADSSAQADRIAFVFLGPVKVGKGTHARAISRTCKLPYFETGNEMRNLAAQTLGNPDYDIVRQSTGSRKLVPPRFVMEALKNWLSQLPPDSNMVLDGIPRNRDQRDAFMKLMSELRYRVMVVWFTTPPEACHARPIRQDRKKEDTDAELLRNATQVYERETLPLLDEFANFGVSEAAGNLLKLDNSHLTERQTAGRLIEFFGLPCAPHDLFPDAKQQMLALA